MNFLKKKKIFQIFSKYVLNKIKRRKKNNFVLSIKNRKILKLYFEKFLKFSLRKKVKEY